MYSTKKLSYPARMPKNTSNEENRKIAHLSAIVCKSYEECSGKKRPVRQVKAMDRHVKRVKKLCQ